MDGGECVFARSGPGTLVEELAREREWMDKGISSSDPFLNVACVECARTTY